MDANDIAGEGLRLVSRLADAAVAIPVTAGYVALGAAVLVGQSLLDVARQTWDRLPSLGGAQPDKQPREPKAA